MNEFGSPLEPSPDAPPPEAPRPLPWEDPAAYPRFWRRAFQTFQVAFTDPMAFFERVAEGEGFLRPWLFALLCSLPSYLLMLVVLLLLGAVFAAVGLGEAFSKARQQNAEMLWVIPVVYGGVLLLLPLFQFLGMLVAGGLNHLSLWLWGGLRRGVGAQHTIRATAYAGSIIGLIIFLPSLIPYLGILIAVPLSIAGMVVTGMGLARLHGTETWRGIAAAFTPALLCCCCACGLWFLAVAGAVGTEAFKHAAHRPPPHPAPQARLAR